MPRLLLAIVAAVLLTAGAHAKPRVTIIAPETVRVRAGAVVVTVQVEPPQGTLRAVAVSAGTIGRPERVAAGHYEVRYEPPAAGPGTVIVTTRLEVAKGRVVYAATTLRLRGRGSRNRKPPSFPTLAFAPAPESIVADGRAHLIAVVTIDDAGELTPFDGACMASGGFVEHVRTNHKLSLWRFRAHTVGTGSTGLTCHQPDSLTGLQELELSLVAPPEPAAEPVEPSPDPVEPTPDPVEPTPGPAEPVVEPEPTVVEPEPDDAKVPAASETVALSVRAGTLVLAGGSVAPTLAVDAFLGLPFDGFSMWLTTRAARFTTDESLSVDSVALGTVHQTIWLAPVATGLAYAFSMGDDWQLRLLGGGGLLPLWATVEGRGQAAGAVATRSARTLNPALTGGLRIAYGGLEGDVAVLWSPTGDRPALEGDLLAVGVTFGWRFVWGDD